MTEKTLMEVIMEAKKDLQKLKENNPHLFPQYANLQMAKDNFYKAEQELEIAQEQWDNL